MAKPERAEINALLARFLPEDSTVAGYEAAIQAIDADVVKPARLLMVELHQHLDQANAEALQKIRESRPPGTPPAQVIGAATEVTGG